MELKFAIASLLMLGSLAAPAFAQGENPDKPYGSGVMTFTTPSGTIERRTVPPAVMAEMTKGAMPMTAGTMMMMHEGKMYMMADKKMPNGKMMSDMAMGR